MRQRHLLGMSEDTRARGVCGVEGCGFQPPPVGHPRGLFVRDHVVAVNFPASETELSPPQGCTPPPTGWVWGPASAGPEPPDPTCSVQGLFRAPLRAPGTPLLTLPSTDPSHCTEESPESEQVARSESGCATGTPNPGACRPRTQLPKGVASILSTGHPHFPPLLSPSRPYG